MKRVRGALISIPLLLCFAFAGTDRLDDSDWWSLVRTELPGPQPSRIVTAPANFRIAGVSLFEDDLFHAVTTRLGKTTQVQRGDAASGRDQLCYVSPDGSVHLIFEQGEVESVFYLFHDGRDWKGSALCRQSRMVSEKISTASGLHLGMSPSEVKKILGNASVENGSTLIYARETKKKTPQKQLDRIRRDDPNHYTDEEFHEQFDFYDEDVYIEARFVNSQLTYLAVSQSGTT